MCSRCVFPVRSLTNVNITFVVELSDNKRVLEMSNIDSYMLVLPVIGKHVLNFLRFFKLKLIQNLTGRKKSFNFQIQNFLIISYNYVKIQ